MVKNLSAMQETPIPSVGQEDPLEKEMTTYSSILAWEIPWTEEPGGGCSPWVRKELGPHWVINIPVYIITPKPVLERPLHVELGTFQKDSKFASVYI